MAVGVKLDFSSIENYITDNVNIRWLEITAISLGIRFVRQKIAIKSEMETTRGNKPVERREKKARRNFVYE